MMEKGCQGRTAVIKTVMRLFLSCAVSNSCWIAQHNADMNNNRYDKD